MKTIVEHIVDSLNEQHEIVTATILHKSGSAPREAGTKMVIRKDTSIEGTIGGGTLEAMAMQLAPEVFKTKQSSIEEIELTDDDARASGMVCGGEVSVLLEHIDALDIAQLNIYHKAKELKALGTDFIMITNISQTNRRVNGKHKWICTEADLFGEKDKEVQGIVQDLRENFYHVKFHLHVGKNRYMIEPFYAMDRLYIVGAGHVSQQIALLSKSLGFYTVVIDDREAFANQERFPSADEIHVVSSTYEGLLQKVGIPPNSYIVIVTRGVDKVVLEQALHMRAKYIGMIGSKTKRNYVYAELLKEGFAQQALDEVHCPIGVSINAQTPEEIAVSIVAELTQVKRS
ncbi:MULTISPECIES: XdhC family aldehyde oxidoreductase maturation factor [unclassified Sulfurospirillum]|uniref:XdhC family aldehyde oxidoreductase maturation factor n=1 Tax=unclassified Sulfurospirillum TaxID=2618290 RepID=UPI0005062851|nr:MULTISPECIES: XdhC/CoxI family protein [unclassified Sulfurospirillum]KFL35108.1 molybdenum dehydrogenase [Sulfurospirillum sp. SCADC]